MASSRSELCCLGTKIVSWDVNEFCSEIVIDVDNSKKLSQIRLDFIYSDMYRVEGFKFFIHPIHYNYRNELLESARSVNPNESTVYTFGGAICVESDSLEDACKVIGFINSYEQFDEASLNYL